MSGRRRHGSARKSKQQWQLGRAKRRRIAKEGVKAGRP
jgi:hypothetical protein